MSETPSVFQGENYKEIIKRNQTPDNLPFEKNPDNEDFQDALSAEQAFDTLISKTQKEPETDKLLDDFIEDEYPQDEDTLEITDT